MKAVRTVFTCQNCGYQSPKWLGRCPDCNTWNSFMEENFSSSVISAKEFSTTQRPVLLKDIDIEESSRVKTRIGELDRVLGGGIVPGSVILIGGDPGIGKSTLSLQLSSNLSSQGLAVLYVSAEESVRQTKLRANRLGDILNDKLYIVNQTDLTSIIDYIRQLSPRVVIIDSIQVIYNPELSSSPGSVSQVRGCTGVLASLAKNSDTSIFLIGHVTKEGTLAGPRVLEHIVDTVLYFEGERYSIYRILRAVKNRFGSTNEIGVFEMCSSGLKEVINPSQIFLSERPTDTSGSVVVSILEGTRPLLVEIQALVSKAGFGYARRRSQGIDYMRLSLLIAVLEKRLGLKLGDMDIFINVAGGIKINDPAADLGVAVAISSSFREQIVPADLVILGEIGLASEVRNISYADLRINEAERLGFKRCILPRTNFKKSDYKKSDIELMGVGKVEEALKIILA